MLPETVRLSQNSKEQLLRLKRRTGIQNWNTLSRWGLCLSLADERPPIETTDNDSNVEMSWRTFAGSQSDVYVALLRLRAARDGVEPEVALRRHLARGIARLSDCADLQHLMSLAA